MSQYELCQFNLDLGTTQDIINSKITLSSTAVEYGSLQLGPDNKIYVAKVLSEYLDIINNPNEIGVACNYTVNALYLNGKICRLGLPAMIQSYFSPIIITHNACDEGVVSFFNNSDITYDSLSWDFGDNNTSTQENPTHLYAAPGEYNITLQINSGIDTFSQTSTVTVYENPQINDIVELKQCDDDLDGFSVFNLNEANVEISANYLNETITYFESQIDAETNNNPIENPNSYTNAIVTTDTVWARLENANGCTAISQINLTVSTTQIPNTFTRDFYQCDNGTDTTDGVATFDFSSVTTEIEALFPIGQSIEVSYYQNELDALLETNVMTNISNYENIGSPHTQNIFIRVENTLNNDCLGLGHHITLVVQNTPIAYDITDDILCDDISNYGEHVFTLSNYNDQILNEQSSVNFEVFYYQDEQDALAGINPLGGTYNITSNVQTIYARIQNRTNTDCFDVTAFQLGVVYLPIAYQPQDLNICDIENDGYETVDLSLKNTEILNGQSISDYTIKYYLFLGNVHADTNELPTNFTTTANPQTIFARVENINSTDCYSVTSFSILLNEQPELFMDDLWAICEGNSVEIAADEGYDYYNWFTGQTTRVITVDQPGQYTVTASNVYGSLVCSVEKTVNVIISNVAEITTVETQDWSQNNNVISVFVEGDGDYEFSLDGVNYQDSSIFTNLAIDDYTVYVRDKNGCGIENEDVYLLNYPRFFTPNGDGENDYWQIKNSGREPLNKLYIYDRYGKLITQLRPSDYGWDGNYNGNKLPSSDYWFVLERQNGKTYTGHFSLKR